MVLTRLICAPCACTLQASDLRISLLTGAQPLWQAVQHSHLLLTSICVQRYLCYSSVSIWLSTSPLALCVSCFTNSEFQWSASALCMLPPCCTALAPLPYPFELSVSSLCIFRASASFPKEIKSFRVFRFWNLTGFYRLHTIWIFQENYTGSCFTQGWHKHLPEIKGSPKNTSSVPKAWKH